MILLLLVAACSRGEAPPSTDSDLEPTSVRQSARTPDATARLLSREQPLMGTRFVIAVWTDDEVGGAEAIDAAFREVARVEALISEWQPTSEISAVNRDAGGGATRVGPEMLEVVERSLAVSERTGGAFDITFASCGALWSFRERQLPSAEQIAECLPRVGYRRIEIDRAASTIRLPTPGTRIGVGGIGKGYGVDRASALLEARGFSNHLVDGGGDVRLSGRRGDRPWSVGIADPRRPGRLIATLHVTRGAVVTSGDYERFFELDGQRYHHILDPSTGWPARRSMATTVVAPEATEADGLSTGIFVLGPEEGLARVETMAGVEALIVAEDGQIHVSSGFEALVDGGRVPSRITP